MGQITLYMPLMEVRHWIESNKKI